MITNRQIEDALHMRQQVPSNREHSPGLEDILHKPFQVLDHGMIRVVDYMGTDTAIVQAARVSYGRGTKSYSDDRGLIRYLMRHKHTTPFEMCEIKLHMKLPIFVARQMIRHRTANVNEVSARYSILAKEFYIPPKDAVAGQSKTNRQGRGDRLSKVEADDARRAIDAHSAQSYLLYEALLNDPDGGVHRPHDYQLARELARMVIPTNIMTEWYWKTDLHNFMNFLELRTDPHAQWEIRQYADKMLAFLEAWVPMTAEAFKNYRRDAFTFSAAMLTWIATHLQNTELSDDLADQLDLTKRERDEVRAALYRGANQEK